MDVKRVRIEINLTQKNSLKIEKYLVIGEYTIIQDGSQLLFLINKPDALCVSETGIVENYLQESLLSIFSEPFYGTTYNSNQLIRSIIKVDSDKLPKNYICIGSSVLSVNEIDDCEFDNYSIVDQYLSDKNNLFKNRCWIRTSSDEYMLMDDDDVLTCLITSKNLLHITTRRSEIKLYDTPTLSYSGTWDKEKRIFEISGEDKYRLICFESPDDKLLKFIIQAMNDPEKLFDGKNFFKRIFPELQQKRRNKFNPEKDYYVPMKAVELVELGKVQQWFIIETELLNEYTNFKNV